MTYPFRKMNAAEIDAFLDQPRHAIVSTLDREGSPQLSPVWFLHQSGVLYMSISATSARHASLRRDPRVAVCVDAGHPDARSVTLLGSVQLRQAPLSKADERLWHARIARRYLSSDEETERYLAKAEIAGGLVLATLHPAKIIARDYN